MDRFDWERVVISALRADGWRQLSRIQDWRPEPRVGEVRNECLGCE